MRCQGTTKINPLGHLEIGGCDGVDLASQFGTPLYVLDEELLRQNCRDYYHSFIDKNNDFVIFASKSFLTKATCRIIQQEGLGLDVVSGGELRLALDCGFPPDKIFLHGNNKSPDELQMALSAGVGRIVIDNFYELETLERLASLGGCHPAILLRIAPGVEAHSHTYISTGQVDSKFGFPLGVQSRQAIDMALESRNLVLKGLHCHIGSQIFQLDAFQASARVMMSVCEETRCRCRFVASELDLGGGLGVYYAEGDTPPTISEYALAIQDTVEEACRSYNYPRPRIIVEPGRSIISPPGSTLYTIGASKEVLGVRKYVAVDGGMSDNPRPALYQAKYEGIIVNKADCAPVEVVSVTGRCCESGDMLIWDMPVPELAPGDLMAIFCTGAYNYSMSSNYNGLPRPAVVLVNRGKAELIVERENYADLSRHHLLPERLL